MASLKSLRVIVTLTNGKEYVSTAFDTPDEMTDLEGAVTRAATGNSEVMSFKAASGSWVLIPADALKTASFELVPTYEAARPEPVFPEPERSW